MVAPLCDNRAERENAGVCGAPAVIGHGAVTASDRCYRGDPQNVHGIVANVENS
jgi:hypothetical protein